LKGSTQHTQPKQKKRIRIGTKNTPQKEKKNKKKTKKPTTKPTQKKKKKNKNTQLGVPTKKWDWPRGILKKTA